MNSQELFKQYPKMTSFHATSDGVKFFTPHDAMAHAKSLKDKKVTEVFRGEKDEAATEVVETSAEDTKKVNPFAAAQLRIEAINALETEAEVNEALKGEKAKTVLAAGAERIAAIKAANTDVTENTDAAEPATEDTDATENAEETKEA